MTVRRSSRFTGPHAAVQLHRALLSLLTCLVIAVPTVVRAQCADYGGTFRFLGASDLLDYGRDVAVDGGLAYVVSGVPCGSCTGRIDIFDLSTVGQPGGGPSMMAGIGLMGGPVTLAVLGERAYVGTSGGQLHVVDVSDLSAPILVTTVQAGETYDLAAAPGLLFAATESGLNIYDLANPDSPTMIGSRAFADGTKSVALSGALAFVVWGGFGSGGSALSVVDVSQPTHPLLLSSIWSTSKASVVAVSGGRAYLGGGFRYRDLYLYGSLDVIDVSDPLNPFPRASLDNLDFPVQGLAINGDAVYATAADPWFFRGGFYVVDASDPNEPILVHAERRAFRAFGPCIADGIVYFCEHRLTGGLRFAIAPSDVHPKALSASSSTVDIYSVDMQADLAYMTDAAPVLKIIDRSDPAHPQLVGSMATPARGEAIEVQGDIAYLGYLMRSVNVVDVSDPQFPQIVASVPQAYGALDIAAGGPWLYTVGWNGMWTIDIANPVSPVARGYLAIDGHAIAVEGAHAYVLEDYGFNVVDLANPAAPVRVGAIETHGARDMAVSGHHAFVVDWQGVQIIDVADPALPVEVGRIEGIENLNSTTGISIQGDHAYLAGDRMQVVDIRDPLHPMVLGGTETQANAWPRDLVAGERAVLIAGENLRVFPPQCPPNDREVQFAWDRRPSMRVAPNPMRDETRLELHLDRALLGGARVPVVVRVVDVAGRPVARLADGSLEAGTHVLRWDGRRDCDGRVAPAGVYWLKVDVAGTESRTARIVRLTGG